MDYQITILEKSEQPVVALISSFYGEVGDYSRDYCLR